MYPGNRINHHDHAPDILVALLLIAIILIVLRSCWPQPRPPVTFTPTAGWTATDTLEPTWTPYPTETPEPTFTPTLTHTATLVPTYTPRPTLEPTVTSTPAPVYVTPSCWLEWAQMWVDYPCAGNQ